MKRRRPCQHTRRLKSGKRILINKGMQKKQKRRMAPLYLGGFKTKKEAYANLRRELGTERPGDEKILAESNKKRTRRMGLNITEKENLRKALPKGPQFNQLEAIKKNISSPYKSLVSKEINKRKKAVELTRAFNKGYDAGYKAGEQQ